MRWLAMIGCLLMAWEGRAQFSAATGSPYATGLQPASVAVGDFNLDGKPDVVTANSGGNNLTILLGDGTGRFTASAGSPVAVGNHPSAVAVGDFNGDGKPDIVTANSADNSVTVLLGDGTGRFVAEAGGPVGVGRAPAFVLVADVNRDGNADIVTANSGDNTLTILLGDGKGGFSAAAGSPVTVGAAPSGLAAADFNGDGLPDLVTANSAGNSLTVLLGDGSGGFANAGGAIGVGVAPVFVVAGDVNGDGKIDIVSVNSAGGSITVLLGNGLGGFQATAASPVAVGSGPNWVAVGDFNGDGVLDLAIANRNDGTVALLLGDGMGGFVAAVGSPVAVGGSPAGLATGDFNRDGKGDLAVVNYAGGAVAILLNSLPSLAANASTLTFYAGVGKAAAATIPVSLSSTTTGSTYSATTSQTWLTAAPGSHATGGVTSVLLSASALSLTPGVYSGTVRYTAPNFFDAVTSVTFSVAGAGGTVAVSAASPIAVGADPQAMAFGDFNGDGNLDLVTANSAGNSVTVLLGDGAGGFAATPGNPVAVGAGPVSIAVADFNGDGKLDLVAANLGANSVTVLLGDGTGGFAAAAGSPFTTGKAPDAVATADFNGDGRPDLAIANSTDNNVTVLLGNGVGGFTPAAGSPFTVGNGPHSVAIGDFNRDGRPDIVTANSSNTVSIILGNGQGKFTAPANFSAAALPQSVVVADFNLDGKPDVVTANSGSTTVTVLLGDGLGGLKPGTVFPVGTTPFAVATGDFNGDGKPDLVVANAGDNTLTILIGNGAGGFVAAAGNPFAVGPFPSAVVVGDLNGDGRADIVSANAAGNSVTVLMGQLAATNAVLSGSATVAFGAALPLTLTVTQPGGGFTTPSGTGTFSDGGTTIGTAAQTITPFTFSAVGLAIGVHTLTAAYSGDASNGASSSNTLSVTVSQASQTLSFTAPAAQSVGSTVTLIATASSGLPISFASLTLTVCTVSGAIVSLVSGGTCTIDASQAGNGNYNAAVDVTQSFTVKQGAQSVTFGVLANMTYGMDPFTVTATATSGLPVVFSSTTATVCTVLSATVTIGGVGTCTIQAAQPGNASYTAAVAVSRSFTVGKASQTITFGALADQVVGAVPFTVSATASSGLTVVFTSSTAAVCTVSSNLVTVVTFGTCSLTATQVGNANYAAAAPVIQTFHVTEGAQTITFGALANQVFGSAPQTLTATASSGLPVRFNSTTTGICTTAAVAVTVISTGTCTIQASQPGNSNYPAALPVSQSFAVTQGAQTIQFAALANKVFGSAPFKITATASSGLTVSLDSATQGGCTVAAGLVTLVGTGTCTIQASQPGNTNYAAATPVVQSLTVATANQTITFAALGSIVFGAASPALSATASSGLAVSYASTTASTCNAADGLLTIVTAGTCTIQASQSGSANYAAALSVSQNLTVTKASQSISFPALANQGVGAAPFSLTATASSGLAVVFSTATKTCTVSNGTVAVVTLLSTGTCTIAAAQPGNASFTAAASVSQSFTIALGTLSVAAVLNAGSYAAGTLAPSGYAVIFGNNLASAVAAATSVALPTTLAGTTVSVTDSSGAKRPAQISYVSPVQVNVLFPAGLAGGAAVVTIANTTGSSGVASVNIASIAPSLFTADSSGSGPPAAYAVAYPSNGVVAPAQVLTVTSCAGSPWVCSPTPIDLSNASQNVYLALFGTGIRGRSSLAGVAVTLGGTAANVTYAGAQGGYAGLDQVNVLLGRSLMGRGLLSLQLTVDGIPTNPVLIDIQ